MIKNVLRVGLSVVLLLAVLVTACACKNHDIGVSYSSEDMVNPYPNAEKMNITLPQESDGDYEERLREIAYQMYTTANENYKNMDNVAIWVKSETTMMGATVVGYRYYLKNSDEFFIADYSHIAEEGGAGALIKAFSSESTRYAAISYTDASLSNVYTKKVVKPKLSLDGNGNVYVDADFSDVEFTTSDKVTYYKEQEADYEQTEQKITKDTIKTVTISYNADAGYYTLELELDVENPDTTAITVENIKKSGVSNPAYTSIFETIEIWDNGYYRYFRSLDSWKGKMSIVSLNSVIDYRSYFHYSERDCDFANYQFVLDLKAASHEYEG